jgi:protein involved in polysaccharide export with SLBB domain
VVDAISLAGGQDKRGELSQVRVIRMVDGKPTQIPVNVTDILKRGKNEQNIALQPKDIVYVPETGKVDWDRVIDALPLLGLVL